MSNAQLLFYKTYYEAIDQFYGNKPSAFNDSVKEKNTELFNLHFDPKSYEDVKFPEELSNTVSSFCMSTAYPGMLVGTGYAHGTGLKDAADDINCGFSLDYVTGMPYIPGSSVKGVLASCFDYPEIIEQFCPSAKGITKELKTSIFGSKERNEEDGVDVFFDAVLRCGDDNGLILGSDYITPHASITKNPNPILLLKILPDVIFEFRFLLKDSNIGDSTVTADEKKALFITLLELFGIGAKTNVGYGILHYIDNGDVEKRVQSQPSLPEMAQNEQGATARQGNAIRQSNSARQGNASRQANHARAQSTRYDDVVNGVTYDGVVTGIQAYGAFVKIIGTQKSGMVHISKISNSRVTDMKDIVSVNQRVRVKVLNIKPDGKIELSMKDADQ